MTTQHTDHLTDLSIEIRDKIMKDESFSTPNLDMIDFEFPESIDNIINSDTPVLTEGALTERRPRGAGMFDAIMESAAAHLKEEYEANRITGAEYSKTYAACMAAALQSAVTYLTTKDRAYWDGVSSRVAAFRSRVDFEISKMQLLQAQIQVQSTKADYASKMANLANLEAEYDNRVAQHAQIEAQTEQIKTATSQTLVNIDLGKFNLNSMMPMQLKLLTEQMESERAKTLDTRTDGTLVVGSIGKSKDLHSQQITSYQRNSEVQAAKLYTDNVVTQLSMENGISMGGLFDAPNLRKVMGTIMTNNGFGNRVPASGE